jgi:hypothetical protein
MDTFRNTILLAVMPVFFCRPGCAPNGMSAGSRCSARRHCCWSRQSSGKLAGIHIAGRILKWEKGEASIIGWLLQTKALIMIIFANILLDKDIITNETFTALLLMAVASTMLTIPVVTPKLKGAGGCDRQAGVV